MYLTIPNTKYFIQDAKAINWIKKNILINEPENYGYWNTCYGNNFYISVCVYAVNISYFTMTLPAGTQTFIARYVPGTQRK